MKEDSLDQRKKEFSLIVEGRPKPKASIRFGKFGAFKDDATAEVMNKIKTLSALKKDRLIMNGNVKLSNPLDPLFSDAIGVKIVFGFIRPKSVKNRTHPHVKPDIDNLAKLVLDALQPTIIADDCLVCDILLQKQYTDNNFTFIQVWEL